MNETKNSNASEDDMKINLYDILRAVVIKMPPKNRFCILLFDEYGLEHLKPTENNEKPHTHIVSFVLRGINSPWKQPIANIFWHRQGGSTQLAAMIVQIISNVLRSGLTIVATVSDHSKVNMDAINILCQNYNDSEQKGETFTVEFNKIHHIYDPCRLLKSVRNNLIKNDLIFDMNGINKVASWIHIQRMYAVDKVRGSNSILKKITVQHVHSTLVRKKVTAFCAQIFSESVGKEIKRSVNLGIVDPELSHTADLILFFDKLFDTCNSDTNNCQSTKPFRNLLKSGSPNFKFWPEAEKILDSIRFLNNSGQIFRPNCLDKWLSTIYGIINVFKMLHKNKIKCLNTRLFNLDVLTNFMQIIRVINSVPGEIYCEPTDGEILDNSILKIVMGMSDGYFELGVSEEC